MERILIPGGLYVDALPSREYVCLVGDTVQTHLGEYRCPLGQNPLFVRCTNVGGWAFAGQSNNPSGPSPEARTSRYIDGVGWSPLNVVPCGTSPLIWDRIGVIHISDCSIGSQGYRFEHPETGVLVTGDQSYSSQQATPPFEGLSEWSYVGRGLYVGQCNIVPGVAIWDGLTLRMLYAGSPRFIRAQVAGEQISVAFMQDGGAPSVIIWTTMDELRALPPVSAPAPPLPIPVPPQPPIPTPGPVPPVPVPVPPQPTPVPPTPVPPSPQERVMTGFGLVITDVTDAILVPHPSGNGFLMQRANGQNYGVNSDGGFSWKTDAGLDQCWQKGNKMVTNVNTYSGIRVTRLEWWD